MDYRKQLKYPVASLPGLPTPHFLITYSIQKWPGPFHDVNDGSVYIGRGVGQQNAQARNFYRMVGNFRKVFNFAFFASQEPIAKIKTAKILLPMCKANEPHFNPWPTSIQQPTKACQRVCL